MSQLLPLQNGRSRPIVSDPTAVDPQLHFVFCTPWKAMTRMAAFNDFRLACWPVFLTAARQHAQHSPSPGCQPGLRRAGPAKHQRSGPSRGQNRATGARREQGALNRIVLSGQPRQTFWRNQQRIANPPAPVRIREGPLLSSASQAGKMTCIALARFAHPLPAGPPPPATNWAARLAQLAEMKVFVITL